MTLRKSLGSLSILFGLFVMALPAFALPDGASQTGNCDFDSETQFKYDIDEGEWEPSDPGFTPTFTYSDEGEPVDATVPEGWTIVCAKVPQPDKGAGISHLIVVQDPDDETTTTTVDDTTTTTVEATTTTVVDDTTTTEEETTTTTEDDTTTTQVIVITPKTPSTLPFTGPYDLPWPLGLGAIISGAGLVALARRMRSE